MRASFVPDLSLWEPWSPQEVARRLAGVDARWAVVAGWSLDLFRGEQTREHDDIEIAVPERGFASVRAALSGFELLAVVDGACVPIDEESLAQTWQTWVRDDAGRWRLDVMRERWDGDTWVFRRDPRIRRAGDETIVTSDEGIPYQRPEIALLFKAKAVREKDETDFDGVLPFLDDRARGWLTRALELAHPGHRWLERLDG